MIAHDDCVSRQRSAQDFAVGSVWTEANKGGTPGGLSVNGIPSGCKNFTPAFTDSITSIQISSGFLCNFYVYVPYFE